MAALDYIPLGHEMDMLTPEYDDAMEGGGGYGPRPTICRHCMQTGLYWGNDCGKPRLLDNKTGKWHICTVEMVNRQAKYAFQSADMLTGPPADFRR